MIKQKLEEFKAKFEKAKGTTWRLFYIEEIEQIQDRTVYITISKESYKNKQKEATLVFSYVRNNVYKGTLDFREEVVEFIKYLALEFAESTFFNKDNEYDIDYQYEEEGDYRIAEVTATFNYTKYRPKDDGMLMDKLVDRIKIDD